MQPPAESPTGSVPSAPGSSRWAAGWVLLALLATLTGPFLLKPKEADSASHYDRRLVIISPHNERVRHEFGRAFTDAWKARTGETVYMDWRIPGGSSEVTLFLKSEFAGAFQYHWEKQRQQAWTHDIATGFADPRTEANSPSPQRPAAGLARRDFLDSTVGVGIDLLFGGGSYDFQQLADAGYLVAGDAARDSGLAAVMARHPVWFSDAAIPKSVSGEPFRDRDNRWSGVVLATFGMVFNRDVLARLGITKPLEQWSDLTDPRLRGQIALADPTKSGSVAKAFELIIQQQMHEAVAGAPDANTEAALERGWNAGLRLVQRISANARYFTDSAAKIPLEVTRGDAAAGMAIDSYGRASAEFVRRQDGQSRVGFVAPRGGTSVSVDPIALLRGAPDPELATAFIEFVLSPRGQKLWAYRAGTPEGPIEQALRRLPVRRDFYTAANRPFMSDPDEQPYVQAESFVYEPGWTGSLFGAIRFLVRVMCVDTHAEQREAWRAIIDHGMPAESLAAFHDLSGLSRTETLARVATVLRAKDKVAEVQLARELVTVFRERYQRAYQLAVAHGVAP
jgi:ABC-type Fe3+ transport system substrate-binding protein